MSTVGWVIALILGVPALALLAWLVISASLVRVPPGAMGLVLVHGHPSDTVLPPGLHVVPALRRRMLELYPAVELAYRAGVPGAGTDELNQAGPPLDLRLGDRTEAKAGFTVRFRLRPDQLRDVHERYGPAGLFGVVRDQVARVLIRELGDPSLTVDELVEPAREGHETSMTAAVAAAVAPLGFEVRFFALGAVDLGRTGELIQQISRARHERELEQVDAATRLARAGHDAELQVSAAQVDEASWRYREADLWRELAHRSGGLQLALRVADPSTASVHAPTPAEADGSPGPSAP